VAGLVGQPGQPGRANGRGLTSGPWQSPGFGPPICCLRQLAPEGSHHVRCRSDRLCPVVGGLRQIRQPEASGPTGLQMLTFRDHHRLSTGVPRPIESAATVGEHGGHVLRLSQRRG
jgi:hypothetical protein